RRVTGKSDLFVISRANVCRPSYRSHAFTHSTPGSSIAELSSQLPCMPIPMMPNRKRSLGAMGVFAAISGSGLRRIVFAASDAPAAAALTPRNSRREKDLFFIRPPLDSSILTLGIRHSDAANQLLRPEASVQ